MAFIYYNKFWKSKFDNIVSESDRLQDLNINQLKLEEHDTHKRDEKTITNFKAVNDEDVTNKAYVDEKLLNTNGQISLLEKCYKELKLKYNKQSVKKFSFKEL